MADLAVQFGNLLWTVASFVIALGVIVAVHEYGHYIIGRWSGIKAEVFSLGFGPVVAQRTDRHGTRWQLAAIPLGGFVRFKGDKDVASAQVGDLSAVSAADRRQTMAGAPLWARTATVAAGPLFNFILAFAIFWGMILASGLQSDRAIIGEMHPLPQAQPLQIGDEIIALNGVETPDLKSFFKVADAIAPAEFVPYTVLRDGVRQEVMAAHPFPPRAAFVHFQNAAFSAGIQTGDVFLQVNGAKVVAFSQLQDVVAQTAGAPLDVLIWRPGQGEIALTLSPLRRDYPTAEGGFETRWMIGISSSVLFTPQMRSAGLLEAANIAWGQVAAVVQGTLSGMAHMIRGDISTCNLSGPVGLASTMGEAARTGVENFISMLAMVSLGVGLLNLMPIPVLDGGHLVFFAYEAITRRKPNPKVLNMAVMVGLFFVLSLTLFAIGNDLTCA